MFTFQENNSIKITYYIYSAKSYIVDTVNLNDIVIKLIKNFTKVNDTEIKKMNYKELNSWLIKDLHLLPFNSNFIETIICDSKFNLFKTTKNEIDIFSSIFKTKKTVENFIARIIEHLHNVFVLYLENNDNSVNLFHKGLKQIKYEKSESCSIIQMADVFSNFLLNSIRYLFYKSINSNKQNNYKKKYLFLKNYINIDTIPIANMNISQNGNDIESNLKFNNFIGITEFFKD